MTLTAERVRELLSYDQETGELRWRVNRGGSVQVGKVAGYLQRDGYTRISIDRSIYYAHRVIWLYVTGEWPKDQIDHVNGKRSDNRFSNLRDVPRAYNQQNRVVPSHNTSGYAGVFPAFNCFGAHIGIKGRTVYLGNFKTAEEASAAYVAAKRQLHPGFIERPEAVVKPNTEAA